MMSRALHTLTLSFLALCTACDGTEIEPPFVAQALEAVDECVLGLHDCGANAHCFDREYGFACACDPGYQGDGRQCQNVDECATSAPCATTATCVDSPGSFSCECASGWRTDGTNGCVPDCRYLYDRGHGDVFISYDEPRGLWLSLRSALDGEEQEVLYSPADVCVLVGPDTRQEVVELGGRPPDPSWDPVGVGAGEAFWYLPEVAIEGRPWFGISTEGVPLDQVPSGELSLALRVVGAPAGARVSSFDSGEGDGTPRFIYSTVTEQLTSPRIVGSHAHMSWTFSHAGDYWLEFTATATTHSGVAVRSPVMSYRFIVR
jgi:surface-anchored protein